MKISILLFHVIRTVTAILLFGSGLYMSIDTVHYGPYPFATLSHVTAWPFIPMAAAAALIFMANPFRKDG